MIPSTYDTTAIQACVTTIAQACAGAAEVDDPHLSASLQELAQLFIVNLRRLTRILFLQAQRDEIIINGAEAIYRERFEFLNDQIEKESKTIKLRQPDIDDILCEIQVRSDQLKGE